MSKMINALGAAPPNIAVDADGNPVTDSVELNMADIKIKFLDKDGNIPKPGAVLYTNMFIVEAPGIDPRLIRSVEIPKLDYSSNDVLTVKIEFFVGVGELPDESGKD